MEMNLVMPNNYVELEQEEMMYVDGEGVWSKIFGTVSGAATIVGGVALLLAPEPTTLSKVGGWSAIVAGASSIGWAWSE